MPDTPENRLQYEADLLIVEQQKAEREAMLLEHPELADQMSESLEPPPGHS